MSEEVLIPKMRRIDKSKKSLRIPWLNIVLVLFFTLLLVGSTFVNICIKHYIIPPEIFSNNNLQKEDFIYYFCIIPQIPFVMFMCSSLGKKMATTGVILYILAGLFVIPIFALGGGVKYVAEYSFGYILGYIPAVLIAGNFLKEKYSLVNIIKAAFCGVLIIHILGIIYMIFIAIIKHAGINFIEGWIAAQSGLKIIYDIVISFVLMLIGKHINEGLKFIL